MAEQSKPRQKCFVIRKGDMRYVFRYAPDRELEALRALFGLAQTEQLNLKLRDAAAVVTHLGYDPEVIRLRKQA